jgi:hypothetical protein
MLVDGKKEHPMRVTGAGIIATAFAVGACAGACTKLLGIDGEYGDMQAATDASVGANGGAGGKAGASGAAGDAGDAGNAGSSAGGASAGGAGGAGGGGAGDAGAAGSSGGGAAEPVPLVNGDFEANQQKTWFWAWDGQKGSGALVPGVIPGWSTDENPGIGGPAGKGDSGVEPGGNPGMRMFLNSVDWDVYQTSSYKIQASDAFELSWDQLDTYPAVAGGKILLAASLYYLDGNNRVAIDTATSMELENSSFVPHGLTVGSVPSQAVGKAVGVSFDNTTPGGQAWVGIDNVRLTVYH